MYQAGDARFRRLLMNKLQLTKGELTKIILEEVRKLDEQIDVEQVAKDEANENLQKLDVNSLDLKQLTLLNSVLKDMQ